MTVQRSNLKKLLAIIAAITLIFMIGCKDSPVDVVDNSEQIVIRKHYKK